MAPPFPTPFFRGCALVATLAYQSGAGRNCKNEIGKGEWQGPHRILAKAKHSTSTHLQGCRALFNAMYVVVTGTRNFQRGAIVSSGSAMHGGTVVRGSPCAAQGGVTLYKSAATNYVTIAQPRQEPRGGTGQVADISVRPASCTDNNSDSMSAAISTAFQAEPTTASVLEVIAHSTGARSCPLVSRACPGVQ